MRPSADFQGTDRYQVLRCLGSGTFGTVYEALDRVRGIPVALKVPREGRALGLFLFKQEFRVLADISHPNLVTLYELVGDGDRWFFTMERVEGLDCMAYLRPDIQRPAGPSLSSSLYLPNLHSSSESQPSNPDPERLLPSIIRPTAPADPDQVRNVFRQITEGLLALHRAGLVHRDLKPSNVLVTAQGRVVILDFGLALDLKTHAPTSTTSVGVGTPAYTAPEHVEGCPASPAGDWYSMGTMLYQALVGQLPFTGTPLDMVRAKRNLEALPPSLLVPGLPGDLETLCLELLAREPADRPEGEAILARLTQKQAQASPPLQTVPLGRVLEIRQLLEAHRHFLAGHPVLARIHGPRGMGKSMLLRHFLKIVRRQDPRTILLRSRCNPEESLPYKAVDGLVDDLSQYLRHLPMEEQAALLPEWTPALARLFPVLNQVPAVAQWSGPSPETADPMAFRRSAFLALRELIARVARRQPLVLVVEDLQWADGDSTPVLIELLRAPAPPFLLALTHDASEPDGLAVFRDLDQPGLGAECRRVDVALDSLGQEEAIRAARAMLRRKGPEADMQAIWAAQVSKGHPFFLAELVHGLRTASTTARDQPTGMEAFTRRRLAALDPAARGLVELLCLAGHPVPWRTLLAAQGAGPDAEALLPMLRNGHHLKVRAAAHGERVVEAYHEGIRQLVQATLTPEQTERGHLQLGEALEALVPRPAQQLAQHFAAAGRSDRASSYALLAAQQARENLAFHLEARFLDLALQHLPPTHPDLPSLAVRRGEALAWAGRSHEAAQAFLRACPLHAPKDRMLLQRRSAEEFFRCGRVSEGITALSDILAALRVSFPHNLPAAILFALWSRGRLALRGFQPSPERKGPIPQELQDRMDLLWALAMGLGPVDVLRTLDFQARHMRLVLDAGDPYRLIRGLAHEAVYQSLQGNRNLPHTRRLLEQTQALGLTHDSPEVRTRILLAEGISAQLQGRWQTAARLLDEADHRLREQGAGLAYERYTAQFQALVAWSVMGELGAVSKRYQTLTLEALERGDLLALSNARCTLGYQVFLARHDPEGAERMLDHAEAEWAAGHFHTMSYHLVISRVNVALYTARTAQARDLLRSNWGRMRRTGYLHPQLFRITSLELRARIHLALAAQARPGSLRRAGLLLWVRMDASRLRREHTSYGEALSLRLQAGCASLSGDASAPAILQQAQEAFRGCDMHLHAATCGWVLSRWIGDAPLQASTEAWMKGQGIQAPEAWSRMHFPL